MATPAKKPRVSGAAENTGAATNSATSVVAGQAQKQGSPAPTPASPSSTLDDPLADTPSKKARVQGNETKSRQVRAVSPEWPTSHFGIDYDSELLE